MENKKCLGTTQTINNTIIGKSYKVITKPDTWNGDCIYVGRIGVCCETHSIWGAKLKFLEGESLYFPFENMELIENSNVVSGDNMENKSIVLNNYYKVVKQPTFWKTACRFIGQIGKCIKIDINGARLNFPTGEDISFPHDCLKEVPAIDLNKRDNGINSENVKIGELFRIVKRPDKFKPEDADALIGKIGKANWTNYRAVSLRFSDGSVYPINFDALERYQPIKLENPLILNTKITASNIIIGREYKLIKLPPPPADFYGLAHLLNKLGKVEAASDVAKGAWIEFNTGNSSVRRLVPFDCLAESTRPSETDLIDIIKRNPQRILNIIKGLRKITRLKPVMDFVDMGILPEVKKSEIPPEIPKTIGDLINRVSAIPKTIGEADDAIKNHVVSLTQVN